MPYLWCHWHSSAQLFLQYHLGICKHLAFLSMVTREHLGTCFLWQLKGSLVTNSIWKEIWIYYLFHPWGVPEDLVVVVVSLYVQTLLYSISLKKSATCLSTMLPYPLKKHWFPPRWPKEQLFGKGGKLVTWLLSGLIVSSLN